MVRMMDEREPDTTREADATAGDSPDAEASPHDSARPNPLDSILERPLPDALDLFLSGVERREQADPESLSGLDLFAYHVLMEARPERLRAIFATRQVRPLKLSTSESFYLAFDPLLTVSQTVPTVAIAPLFVLWFGYGLLPKVLLVVITTFFPVTVALANGFRSVDQDQIDLMRTMRATEWQIFRYAKLPAAMDQFFSGLRISATYAIVGAVISEWLGGFWGLGVYMTRVRKSFSYDRMFAVIIIISALSLALMRGVDVLERICMPWKRAERNDQQ